MNRFIVWRDNGGLFLVSREGFSHIYKIITEIIIKNNIIAYPEHRQAEPINLAKIDNFIDIEDTTNIEKKIVIMKEVIKNYEKRD